MSLEKILIIKRTQESYTTDWKSALETCPEHYSVAMAKNYSEGNYLLRTPAAHESERYRLAIIDADEVDTYTLELISNIRGAHGTMPVLVLTNTATSYTRQSLTSLSSECLIKTGEYEKFLWQSVKNSLARMALRPTRSSIRSNKGNRTFVVGKRKA